jgi:hypothetical protein
LFGGETRFFEERDPATEWFACKAPMRGTRRALSLAAEVCDRPHDVKADVGSPGPQEPTRSLDHLDGGAGRQVEAGRRGHDVRPSSKSRGNRLSELAMQPVMPVAPAPQRPW